MNCSFIYLLILFLSLPVYSSTLKCEAWYQGDGAKLERVLMPLTSSTANNTVFAIAYNGYDYRVDWDKNLTSFYITIAQAEKRILFATARVPTENHPENFTDLYLPGGPRLSINCEEK